MKLIPLSLLLIFTISICNAQMKPIVITLKSGEKLKGIGRKKGYTFKYKADENAKPQEFEFSIIKSAEIELSQNEITTYKCYQTKDSEKFIAVVEIISGNKAELFTTTKEYNTDVSGGMGMGGMSFGGGTVTHYYVKKANEDRLTDLGEYSPLTNDLKGKVKTYFSDCKSLIEKLESREFKVKEGLENIVIFYNKNCE